MKYFKSLFEQLDDYFKIHDKDNMVDVQSNYNKIDFELIDFFVIHFLRRRKNVIFEF